MAEPRTRLSMDEINDLITQIAIDGDGADRLRALKILQAEKQADVILPDPLSDGQVVDRLARLMRGAGRRNTRLSYLRAFRPSLNVQKTIQALGVMDLGLKSDRLPRTLKQLYRRYPEVKRPGFPKGYPVNKSIAAQQQWVRAMAVKIEAERRESAVRESLANLEEGVHVDTITANVAQTETPAERGAGSQEGTL